MAKRKPARSRKQPAKDAPDPDLESAVEEVRAARQRLREARSRYEQLLRAAAGDEAESADDPQSTLQTAISQTLDLVKKYPGPGLLAAAVAGFFFGRQFRR